MQGSPVPCQEEPDATTSPSSQQQPALILHANPGGAQYPTRRPLGAWIKATATPRPVPRTHWQFPPLCLLLQYRERLTPPACHCWAVLCPSLCSIPYRLMSHIKNFGCKKCHHHIRANLNTRNVHKVRETCSRDWKSENLFPMRAPFLTGHTTPLSAFINVASLAVKSIQCSLQCSG